MEIDREVVIEAVAATAPVLAMIAGVIAIAAQFSDGTGGVTPTGGQAIIAAFVVFVFAILGIGLALSRAEVYGGDPNGS